MLDNYFYPKINRFYRWILQPLQHSRLRPNHISIVGFFLGLWASWEIWQEHYYFALLPLLLNRFFDGLDGALAQIQGSSSLAGAFLDICFDFCIYGLFILAFALAVPERAIAAAFLLFCYLITGTSFLALSSALSKTNIDPGQVYRHKKLYFISSLCEGTETILVMFLLALLPAYFSFIALIYGILCILTTVLRWVQGYLQLSRL